MPIFVSRFSAERIASAGLSRLRNFRLSDRRESIREARREERAERAEREQPATQTERAQDQLPVATQHAESVRDQLRNQVNTALGRNTDQTSEPETERQELPMQATLPGVPTVSEDNTGRVRAETAGRLDQNARPTFLPRFESYAASTRSAVVRKAFQNIPSTAQNFEGLQLNRLNAQTDATIRLFRSRNEQAAAALAEVPAETTEATVPAPDTTPLSTAEESPATSEPEASSLETPVAEAQAESAPAAPEEEAPAGAQEAPTPSAKQISRANTTSEIQENLRADSAEIGGGLRADAEIQTQENVRQTAANAERNAEASRESRIEDNDEQVRDLTVQERQLEQSLRATQSEIRELNSESNRLENGSTPDIAATAASLAGASL